MCYILWQGFTFDNVHYGSGITDIYWKGVGRSPI